MANKAYNDLDDEDRQKIVQTYFDNDNIGKNFTQMANSLCVSKRSFPKVLKDFGINTKLKRRYNIESKTYFDVIDTERKAYFLGLLFADGHNGYLNDISISLKNIGNAENVLQCLVNELGIYNFSLNKFKKNNLKFSDKYEGVLFNISDEYISNALAKQGMNGLKCETRKSIPKDIIEYHLEPHFIRGLFDGDGSYTYRYIQGDTKLLNKSTISFMGSEELLNEIRTYFKNTLTTNHVQIRKSTNSNKIYELRYKENQTIRIINHLYQNATIYLSHKVPYNSDIVRKPII